MGFRIDTPNNGDGLKSFWVTRRNVGGGVLSCTYSLTENGDRTQNVNEHC